MIDFKGGKIRVRELAKLHNLPWTTIKSRYDRGFRDDDLIVKKIRDTRFKGVPTTLKKIADQHGLPIALIESRHASGLRDEALVAPYHRGQGNERGATKLDVDKVIQIKKLLATTNMSQREIAAMFGIGDSHVSAIQRGKAWAKVKINLGEILAANT
jgi:hypothetical protein